MSSVVRSATASCIASDCGEQRVVEVRRDPVEDRVSGLVRDDVLRMAGVDRAAAVQREVEELQAVRLALVERVGPLPRPRHHQELRSVECPAHRRPSASGSSNR